jgi:hypothetical protein
MAANAADVAREGNSGITVANYCVCFIDLLGQRQAMSGQGLLPAHATQEEYGELVKLVKGTVGKIYGIHKDATAMLARMNKASDPPAELNEAERDVWLQFQIDGTVVQRWSDGLMAFASLGGPDGHPVIHNVYSLLCLAGAMCLLGLARKSPLRGGVDIAWGVELHAGELYGPAVANAYTLESERAELPRIAIGEHVAGYLNAVRDTVGDDAASKIGRLYATICLGMLGRDAKGIIFLDYLSEGFEKAVTANAIEILWPRARSFIDEQVALHTANKTDKLTMRYQTLAAYFDVHLPPSKRAARH